MRHEALQQAAGILLFLYVIAGTGAMVELDTRRHERIKSEEESRKPKVTIVSLLFK